MRPGALSAMRAVTVLESIPPLRKTPSGTSLMRRLRTDSLRRSASSRAMSASRRAETLPALAV